MSDKLSEFLRRRSEEAAREPDPMERSRRLKLLFEDIYAELEKSAQPQALVSACLLGVPCRYDGKSKPDLSLCGRFNAGELIPVCPEVQGGLPTPRTPSGVTESGQAVLDGCGRVINRQGEDVSFYVIKGAEIAYRTAERFKVCRAVLKQHSPSCGCGSTGGVQGTRLTADGVACALLKSQGLTVEAAGE